MILIVAYAAVVARPVVGRKLYGVALAGNVEPLVAAVVAQRPVALAPVGEEIAAQVHFGKVARYIVEFHRVEQQPRPAHGLYHALRQRRSVGVGVLCSSRQERRQVHARRRTRGIAIDVGRRYVELA